MLIGRCYRNSRFCFLACSLSASIYIYVVAMLLCPAKLHVYTISLLLRYISVMVVLRKLCVWKSSMPLLRKNRLIRCNSELALPFPKSFSESFSLFFYSSLNSFRSSNVSLVITGFLSVVFCFLKCTMAYPLCSSSSISLMSSQVNSARSWIRGAVSRDSSTYSCISLFVCPPSPSTQAFLMAAISSSL